MERAPAPVMVRQQGGGEGEQAVLLRQLPPGFRFHPTDEELVVQYLRRKALSLPLPAAVIPEVHDLFKLDPWDIPGASEGEKYFFAVRPAAGSGSKRGGRPTSTASGFWKPAGGKEKPVVAARCGGNYLVGVKIPMVFVPRRRRGKAGGAKAAPPPTDWAMHEYRLALPPHHKNGCCFAQAGSEEWVVCRIFQRDRPSSTRRQTPAGHDATAVHRTMPMPPSPSSSSSSSSSSCVTGGSGGSVDQQEEVSSS